MAAVGAVARALKEVTEVGPTGRHRTRECCSRALSSPWLTGVPDSRRTGDAEASTTSTSGGRGRGGSRRYRVRATVRTMHSVVRVHLRPLTATSPTVHQQRDADSIPSKPASGLEHHKGQHQNEHVHFPAGSGNEDVPKRRPPRRVTPAKVGESVDSDSASSKSKTDRRRTSVKANRRDNTVPAETALEHHKGQHGSEHVHFAENGAVPGKRKSNRKNGKPDAAGDEADIKPANQRTGKKRRPTPMAAGSVDDSTAGADAPQKDGRKKGGSQPSDAKGTLQDRLVKDGQSTTRSGNEKVDAGKRQKSKGPTAKSTGTAGTKAGAAAPPKTTLRRSRKKRVNSFCGSSVIEVDFNHRPHVVHDKTLGGHRRQRHNSWHPVVESPWLANDIDDDDSDPPPRKEKKGKGVQKEVSQPQKTEEDVDSVKGVRAEKRGKGGAARPPPQPRPEITHFVAVRVTNPEVMQNLTAAQKSIAEAHTPLETSVFPSEKFHVTLGLVEKPGAADEKFEVGDCPVCTCAM